MTWKRWCGACWPEGTSFRSGPTRCAYSLLCVALRPSRFARPDRDLRAPHYQSVVRGRLSHRSAQQDRVIPGGLTRLASQGRTVQARSGQRDDRAVEAAHVDSHLIGLLSCSARLRQAP